RNLLIHEIAQRSRIRGEGGHGILGINDLLLSQTFVDFFPLHDGPYEYEPTTLETPTNPPENPRSWLYQNWSTLHISLRQMLGAQPIKEVRSYFGEKVAYYFSFLGFYTLWLYFPAILGVIVFLFGVSQTPNDFYASFDNALTVPFAFFMAVWVCTMLEFWKRQEVTLRTIWGCGELVDVETRRPEWIGVILRRSPITERIEPHFPSKAQLWVKLVTTAILMCAICVMVFFELIVITVSALRINTYLATGLSSLLTLLNIVLITPLYLYLAYVLTQWENHKTFQRFEDALITKKFIFVFIQNFSTLLFIGIIKVLIPDTFSNNLRTCSLDDASKSCMSELMFSMAIIFVGLQFVTQIQLVVVPMVMQVWRKRHQEKIRAKMIDISGTKKGEAEKSAELKAGEGSQVRLVKGDPQAGLTKEGSGVTFESTTHPNHPPVQRVVPTKSKNVTKTFQNTGSLSDLPQHLDDDLLDNWTDQSEFNSKIIQLGFVSLFSVAFPLAPLFALINNSLEIRFGAYRLLAQSQRPFPLRVKGVGAWFDVAVLMSRIGIMVNALIIAFSSQYFNKRYIGWVDEGYRLGAKLAFALLFEHLVFLVVFMIDRLTPDTPGHIRSMIERQKYLTRLENEEEYEMEDEVEFIENAAKGPLSFFMKR
ncbi:Anoctamin-7, partial [Dinochytrium kinnereticum]